MVDPPTISDSVVIVNGITYQAIPRDEVLRVLGQPKYEKLLKDKIRNLGPTPDTVYTWNVHSYMMMPEPPFILEYTI